MIMRMRERKWTIRKEEGRECFMRARDNTGAGSHAVHPQEGKRSYEEQANPFTFFSLLE